MERDKAQALYGALPISVRNLIALDAWVQLLAEEVGQRLIQAFDPALYGADSIPVGLAIRAGVVAWCRSGSGVDAFASAFGELLAFTTQVVQEHGLPVDPVRLANYAVSVIEGAVRPSVEDLESALNTGIVPTA